VRRSSARSMSAARGSWTARPGPASGGRGDSPGQLLAAGVCCHALSLRLAAGLSSLRTLHAMACAWRARRVMMAVWSDRAGLFGVPSGASSGRSFNRSMEERQQMSRVVWRSAARTASRSAVSPAGELSPRVVNAAPLPAVSSPTSGLADTCPDRPKAPSRLRTPRHSALDGASDAPLTASASAELQACIAAGATSTRTDDERTAQRGQWPRSDALLQMTGVRVSSERRGASTSFRPDPDSRDVFCAKAGCPAAAPTGIQPAATAGFGESRPQEGRFRVGRSNPRRVDQLKQGLPSRRTR
jgi:hypothetical protein